MGFWNGTQWSVPSQPSRTDTRRGTRSAVTSASLITVLILGLTAGSVFAGRGGATGGGGKPTTSSSLTLELLDSTDGSAHHLQRVTFKATQTATDRPFVGVRCWQGSNWVLDAYVGIFDGYMFDPWVTLGSDYWAAGVDATCTARLFHSDKRGNQVVLATLNFPALS